jgi:arylsulfatase A-like enzyme
MTRPRGQEQCVLQGQPSARIAPQEITEPVGQLDLAPTFCQIAGVPLADWMQGAPLPMAPGSGRERVITEWDSQFAEIGMHLRSIHRDGFTCTVYEPTSRDIGFSLARLYGAFGSDLPVPDIRYDGSEGELYNVVEDPLQWHNLWNDPGYAQRKSDLITDLYDHLPRVREPQLKVQAPA